MELQLATPSRSLTALRSDLLVAVAAACAVIAVLAVLLVPRPASGQKKQARDSKAQKLEREGLDAYAKGDYAAAASAFERAYAISPDEHILFAWGQAERFRGNCRRAVDLFEKLLKTRLSEANRDAVVSSLEECQARIAADRPSGPEPPEGAERREGEDTAGPRGETSDRAAPDDGQDADEPDDTSPAGLDDERVALAPTGADSAADPIGATTPPGDGDGAAWYRDPVGGALTGAGVVALGVGIGLYVSASSANSSADEAESYVEFSDFKDRARSRGRLAVAGISAGAVLLGAGVAWYVLRGGSNDETATPGEGLSLWWDQRGAGVGFARTF